MEQSLYSLEDFTIEDCYEPEPIENALYSTKQKLKSMREQAKKVTGADSQILVMGSGENFRHEMKLPIQYKNSRKDTHKPLLLNEVRQYLKDHHAAIDVKGIEADDYIAQLGFRGWRDWKRTGVFSYCQGVVDKDAYQTNSLIWNPQKDRSGQWMYEEPILVDGLGSLYRNEKGDVKGTGFAWLMFQTFGDPIDGYNCTNLSNKRYGFGDVARYETLKDCITPPEYLQAVLDKYTELFGERVQYEAWDETEMDIPIVDYIEMHFCCAYMRRWKDDNTSFNGLCNKYGVGYGN